jgi:AraC-like DNA-binding protein
VTLAPRHVAEAAYIVEQELARRRRTGTPIPAMLMELHRALNCELAARVHENGCTPTSPPRIETVAERARRMKVSESTLRRNARMTGAHKVGRDWIWIVEN